MIWLLLSTFWTAQGAVSLPSLELLWLVLELVVQTRQTMREILKMQVLMVRALGRGWQGGEREEAVCLEFSLLVAVMEQEEWVKGAPMVGLEWAALEEVEEQAAQVREAQQCLWQEPWVGGYLLLVVEVVVVLAMLPWEGS
jgi:hypothetical protein